MQETTDFTNITDWAFAHRRTKRLQRKSSLGVEAPISIIFIRGHQWYPWFRSLEANAGNHGFHEYHGLDFSLSAHHTLPARVFEVE
jgi:hypothetical protein